MSKHRKHVHGGAQDSGRTTIVPQLLALVPADPFALTDAGAVPEWIHIMPVGQWEHETYGAITVSDTEIDELIRNFESSPNDLVVDYEHQSTTGRMSPAAGWIRAMEKRIEGIWAQVQWTEKASEMIKNREYRYISPAWTMKAKDKTTGADIGAKFHSIALTNTPWFHGMMPIAASDRTGGGARYSAYVVDDDTNLEENAMLEKLRTLLGLAESATETDVCKAVEALKAPTALFTELGLQGNDATVGKAVDKIKTLLFAELGLKGVDATVTKAVEAIAALRTERDSLKTLSDTSVPLAKFTALQAEVTQMRTESNERTAAEKVTAALKDGKITPAQGEWAKAYALKDPQGFDAFVAAQPVVVDMKRMKGGQAAAGDEIGGNAQKLIAMVQKREADSNGSLTYAQAHDLVCRENPDLAKAALSEARGQ